MKRSTSGVRRSKVKVVRAEHRYGGVAEASFSTISGLVGTLFECFSNSRLEHGVKHRSITGGFKGEGVFKGAIASSNS